MFLERSAAGIGDDDNVPWPWPPPLIMDTKEEQFHELEPAMIPLGDVLETDNSRPTTLSALQQIVRECTSYIDHVPRVIDYFHTRRLKPRSLD